MKTQIFVEENWIDCSAQTQKNKYILKLFYPFYFTLLQRKGLGGPQAILLTAEHQNIHVKSVGVFKKEGPWRRWGVAASVAGVRGSFGTLGRARSRDLSEAIWPDIPRHSCVREGGRVEAVARRTSNMTTHLLKEESQY